MVWCCHDLAQDRYNYPLGRHQPLGRHHSLRYSSVALNGFFLALVAGVFASQGLNPARPGPSTTAYDEMGKLQTWFEKRFHYERWRKALREDIARLEHELDTVNHQINKEECKLCRESIQPNNSPEQAADIVPLIVTESSAGGMYRMSLVEEKPKRNTAPEFSLREQAEMHRYIERSPFMRWEEGDEITERNARGDICLTYTTPGHVVCKICDKTYLHRHDEVRGCGSGARRTMSRLRQAGNPYALEA